MYNYFFLILGYAKMDLTFSDSDLSFRKEVVTFLDNEYPADIKETQKVEFSGIYRGTKHDTAKEKSSNPQHGVYRGVKWVA